MADKKNKKNKKEKVRAPGAKLKKLQKKDLVTLTGGAKARYFMGCCSQGCCPDAY